MFGLLKNKLAGFINGLTGREEKKETASPASAKPEAEPKMVSVPAQEPSTGGKIESKAELPIVSHVPNVEEAKVERKEWAPVVSNAAGPAEGAKAIGETPSAAEKEEAPAIAKAAEPAKKEKAPMFAAKAEMAKAKFSMAEGAAGKAKTVENALPMVPQKHGMAQPTIAHEAVAEKHDAAPMHGGKMAQESRKSLIDSILGLPQKAKAQPASPEKIEKTPPAHFEPDISRLEKKASSEKRDMAPRIGLGTTIKSFFSGEITISESEVSDLIEELELSLLEADVEYGVSMEVAAQLRSRLVGMKVPKGEVASRTRETIAQVLESIMESERRFDFLGRVSSLEKPVKILFVGPNGAGKTTTMAKMARMLMESGLTSVFSASDTFRAAAIEQTEVHGSRLGIKVIKSKYGADPSSVAFDAINFARSHSIDVVLIDSAGRQDTNANLLSELKKINRVAKPDLKLYVGESIGGNALIDQIRAFHEAIGIDGAILTKLDCDAKGGTAISIAKATGIPILFLGVGQNYEDLVPFNPHKIAQEIMSQNS